MFKKKFPSLSSLGSDGNTAFLRAARAGHLDKVLEHLKSNIDINTSNTNGLNALHLASKDGHVNVVTELLKRGAVVDSATKKGNTALHIASLAGQEDVVKLLVSNGASVNVQSQNGFTPLYMAAQENHDNVVRFLLANGANQSLATEDGFTPLAVAMQQGHDKVVAVLLENDTRGKVRLPALHIAAKKDDCKAAALLLQNDHNPDVTSKSGFTPLHIAAHYGNEGIGNLLLSRGADVNYSAKHNISPLHVAAKWGKTNLVSLLLEKGANIESKTRDGLTPLHCAARSGHEQVVDMMLERGAPISSKTKNGLAPLHMAAQGDHVDAARILLYHRAPVDEVTVDYLTALHVAAHCGHVRVAKLLLDRKADPNARALNGFTPLHIACKKNRIKVVELLLKHGGSIEATTESGLTPLHVASFMGCMNIVIFLLQNDASPDVPTVRGETPLHLAARANQTDIIRILLRNGAQVDARAREQQTPLHIASRLGNVDIVMLLLQHGAAVDSTTKDMYTALHIAAKEGQEEVASVLLEHGASLTATTKKGFTPLHLAAKYGNIKVAKLLLQKEAPVDAQGKNGVTPLHVASHYDHQNVALLLLDKGASPHATAKNGHTPLHIAARKNQMDIATTLLEYGAKANAESKAGFTPLHLSAQEGHNDMSTLLIEHQADTNHKAKNGLTPLHLCAQEDRVNVAAILVKNGAQVDSTTKAGYTPLHVASHFGHVNMIRFLLQHGADVKATTSIGYTPLHQAAQQGHTTIVSLLLENSAPPNIQTNQGQTPLSIAQKLGYISVVETLKVVTEPTAPSTTATTDEKYRVVAPETMQETFMSDSEDEGGEDTMLSDQPYRYLTVDEMKSLGDDSLPIDVTRDERMDSNREHMAPPQAVDDTISPQHVKESYAQYAANYAPDNVDLARHPVHVGFLVSFLVDARGGAMRGCRHSGVRVIVPPRKAAQPMRVTCRYLKRDKLTHPPPLMEGEALASRILELGPVGAKFLGPVIIEVPHFGSLRGMEREIVILRSDNGETWREHTMEASDEAIHDVLNESFEADELSALEEPSSGRTTRILTTDFPQYFAVVSRIRQEVHAIGPEGGMVSSSVVPQVQAVFPQGALTKKIKVGLQAQPIPAELAAKLLGNRVAVSPIVTVEPRRRKFHKPITLTIPVPQAANKGMINQYSGDAPTLRLLCSITGGTTRAQWEDVTGSTPLTFVNDCVSFTTTVSARFWLMDCRNIAEATKMATELYKEAIHVPFMAKFVVFAKRTDVLEARLRVFCMTDDKEDKTLEHQEHFTEVAKSRDVEVLEGKPQFVEFSGNLVPVTKSGDQLQLGFRAFKENRLPFTVRVKDPHADTVGRVLFMREGRIAKGEPPQQPICILNIVLPDNIVPETTVLEADLQALNKKYSFLRDGGLGRLEAYQRTDLRLSDISNLLGQDWVPFAGELNISTSEINMIKSECPESSAQQAMAMLRLWLQQQGNKANGRTLETALRKLGRDDIVHQCIFNVDEVDRGLERVKLDQSGFDSLKEELGPSRDTSLRRNISLDAAFDEQDIMKESESVEELVLQEKVKPAERLKERRRDSDETETKYLGEEKIVVEEQKSVSQLKEIFAADKRDRQYERQPSIGSIEEKEKGRPVSMVEQVTKRTISTSDDRPKSAVEIVEKVAETTKEEPEEETSLSVDEIRKRFSVGDEKPEKTVTTTVTKVTKKVSGIPVVPKTPEAAKKASGIPTPTQKTTEIQETVTKTLDDGSKKTTEVTEVVTKTIDDGSKKVTETVSQKTSGLPKLAQKPGEVQDVVPKVTETITTQKVSGIPVISTKTSVMETTLPKGSEFVSQTSQEVTITTKTSGIPVVTKTTKVTEKIIKSSEDGKEVVTKTVDEQKQIFDKSAADQRRDSELFQGVSEELGRLETSFKVVPVEDGILSPKVSKTPPPSPAEFNREPSGPTAWSTGGSLSTELQPTTQEWTGKPQDAEAARSGVSTSKNQDDVLKELANAKDVIEDKFDTAAKTAGKQMKDVQKIADDAKQKATTGILDVKDDISESITTGIAATDKFTRAMKDPMTQENVQSVKKVSEQFLTEESKNISGNLNKKVEKKSSDAKRGVADALEIAGHVVGSIPIKKGISSDEHPVEERAFKGKDVTKGITDKMDRDIIPKALETAGQVAGTVPIRREFSVETKTVSEDVVKSVAEESTKYKIPEALEIAGTVAGTVPMNKKLAADESKELVTEAVNKEIKSASRTMSEELKHPGIPEALDVTGEMAGVVPLLLSDLSMQETHGVPPPKSVTEVNVSSVSAALRTTGHDVDTLLPQMKASLAGTVEEKVQKPTTKEIKEEMCTVRDMTSSVVETLPTQKEKAADELKKSVTEKVTKEIKHAAETMSEELKHPGISEALDVTGEMAGVVPLLLSDISMQSAKVSPKKELSGLFGSGGKDTVTHDEKSTVHGKPEEVYDSHSDDDTDDFIKVGSWLLPDISKHHPSQEVSDDNSKGFTTESVSTTVSELAKHGITDALEIAGQIAGTAPVHKQLSADEDKEAIKKKVSDEIQAAVETMSDDMKHPGVTEALDVCGELVGAVPLLLSDMSMQSAKIPSKKDVGHESFGLVGSVGKDTVVTHKQSIVHDKPESRVHEEFDESLLDDDTGDLIKVGSWLLPDSSKHHPSGVEHEVTVDKSSGFTTESIGRTVTDMGNHGITEALEIAGQIAGTVPLHKQLSADEDKEAITKKVSDEIQAAVETMSDDMKHPGITEALDVCGELAGAVPLLLSDMSMVEGKAAGKKEIVVEMAKNTLESIGKDVDESIDQVVKSSTKSVSETVTKGSDFVGKRGGILVGGDGVKSPEKKSPEKSKVGFVGIQHSDTVIEVNPQNTTTPQEVQDTFDESTPYVTTPTLSRRGLKVGGSQRLTRDQRPAPLDITNMPDDDDSEEDDNYIVTEPVDEPTLHMSQESRVHSSPDILAATKQPPLIPKLLIGGEQERKRRPMFHIESEEDDLTDLIIDYKHENEPQCRDYRFDEPQELECSDDEDMNVGEPEVVKGFMKVGPLGELMKGVEIVKETTMSKVEGAGEILKDLSKHVQDSYQVAEGKVKDVISKADDEFEEEFEKAMDAGENLTDDLARELETAAGGATDKIEKKLRRVERRFERMASETLEKEIKESAEPDVEQKREADFQRMISQLSTEEVMDCQKDFSQLWEEGGMSMTPSEEWDSASRDPDTPSHELDEDSPQVDYPMSSKNSTLSFNQLVIPQIFVECFASDQDTFIPESKVDCQRTESVSSNDESGRSYRSEDFDEVDLFSSDEVEEASSHPVYIVDASPNGEESSPPDNRISTFEDRSTSPPRNSDTTADSEQALPHTSIADNFKSPTRDLEDESVPTECNFLSEERLTCGPKVLERGIKRSKSPVDVGPHMKWSPCTLETSPLGDTSGEWAARDPPTQEATSARGTEGVTQQGAAGGVSFTTTETRTVEDSGDPTMQELLDKLAAEQRK